MSIANRASIKRVLIAGLFLAAAGHGAAAAVTDVRLQNTSGIVQTSAPITFGQVFAVGAVKKSDVLIGSLAGAAVPLQVDVKATHADGSVRHAIISAVVPKLAAGTAPLSIATGGAASSEPTASFRDARATANVTLTVDGTKYTASLADALASTPAPWLAGPIAAEAFVDAPLKNAAGVTHPMLTARYGVRWYPGAKVARVEVVVENTGTFRAPARNFTYDVVVDVGGRTVYSKSALTHYHHARWHQYFWTGVAPTVNVAPNAAYLIASKAVSNYEQGLSIPDYVLGDLRARLTPDKTGPMKVATSVEYMGTTGGREDIGPLPSYSVFYLLTGDHRARDVMMANADGSGSWSMHMRDEKTGYPIRTDNPTNALTSTHMNLSWKGPLPVPRMDESVDNSSPFSADVAHHPSLAYFPYLITGDYFYLEELHFWAASNPLETDPGFSGMGQGLLRWHQVRGQAWSMRTLGHAAYITPDDSPMKAYFLKQLDNNLDYYGDMFVTKNPNKLGVYDGSGPWSAEAPASAPWQDDFLTWSFGYLNELGFSKALPILEWKSKYSIGRLTAPGFCWIAATAYTMQMRDDAGKVFGTFADMYKANFDRDQIRSDDGGPKVGPAGVRFIDLPCGSQAQADYLNVINGNYGWRLGQMMGYSDGSLGYAANLQPGLSLAVGVNPDGQKAWTVFMNRAGKPNYATNPQWDIVPRPESGIVTPASAASPTTPAAPSTPATPTVPSVLSSFKPGEAPTAPGNWARVGYEFSTITLPTNSVVRYGIDGAYVYGTISGTFPVSNDTFGKDPATGKAKQVELFTSTGPAPAPAPAKRGTITTPSSVTVAKRTGLTYRVFVLATLVPVKDFVGVSPSSKNVFTLSDPALIPGTAGLAGAVIDPTTGLPLTVQYPLIVK